VPQQAVNLLDQLSQIGARHNRSEASALEDRLA
jgi:hypothetical protein